jgi:hypothetical protein
MSNAHILNWCRCKGIPWTEHPQSSVQKNKTLILTTEDHKWVVEDGLAILDMVNRDICAEGGPFVAIGDPEGNSIKSFWHKVRCKVCGDLFQLCPPKKNLAANLTNHVMGIKHVTKVEEAVRLGHLSGSTISTGRRGRPTTSSKNTLGNQNDLHNWFRAATRFEGGCTKIGGGASGNFFSILNFLCWGNRRLTYIYSGKSYDITSLLMDPMPGFNWVLEPHTNDKLHVVSGCFRHKVCKRFSSSGEPFTDFTCNECCNIPQESDFRMRVVCEDVTLEKRGRRSTGLGRRLGYLSNAELATHSRSLEKRLNHEKLKVWYHKKKVAQLQMTRPNLKDISHECLNHKDVMLFCQNIVAAHRTGAFGGKPALWDFFQDVAQNLNRKKAGH